MIPGDKVGESSLNSPQGAAHLGGPVLTLCNRVRKDTAPCLWFGAQHPCSPWLAPLGACAVSTWPEATGGGRLQGSWVSSVPWSWGLPWDCTPGVCHEVHWILVFVPPGNLL